MTEKSKQAGLQRRPTQEDIVLKILQNAKEAITGNGWIDGMYFLHLSNPITQSKARMFALKKKGYVIESRFKEGKNWKEYRLISCPKKYTLITCPSFSVTNQNLA